MELSSITAAPSKDDSAAREVGAIDDLSKGPPNLRLPPLQPDDHQEGHSQGHSRGSSGSGVVLL